MKSNQFNKVFYAERYHPIQAGSIDGTDTVPHDNAVSRALLCSSASLYDPFGDSKVIGDPYCTLFVGRLSHSSTEQSLLKAMSEYGCVKNLRLVRHIVTGASRGYAFVEYETEREMRRAYRDAHHSIIDDNKIMVDYCRQLLMPGWIPRRLGGGVGGRKESGQLRFGGRERPFRAPLQQIPYDALKSLGIPLPPEGRYLPRSQDPSPPRKKRDSDGEVRCLSHDVKNLDEENSRRNSPVDDHSFRKRHRYREEHPDKRSLARGSEEEESRYDKIQGGKEEGGPSRKHRHYRDDRKRIERLKRRDVRSEDNLHRERYRWEEKGKILANSNDMDRWRSSERDDEHYEEGFAVKERHYRKRNSVDSNEDDNDNEFSRKRRGRSRENSDTVHRRRSSDRRKKSPGHSRRRHPSSPSLS